MLVTAVIDIAKSSCMLMYVGQFQTSYCHFSNSYDLTQIYPKGLLGQFNNSRSINYQGRITNTSGKKTDTSW